ncbi:MAG: hypothetical protein ACRDY7_11785 [Acidimicrobiia bacterium]
MERSLVSGAKEQAEPVARSLEQAGLAVSVATTPDEVSSVTATLEPESLTCYVQLPFPAPTAGVSPVRLLAGFLGAAVVDRCEAAALVVPFLRADATVVLVAREDAPHGIPDDVGARLDLLRVLSRALAASCPSGEVKSVVAGADHSPEEIATLAAARGEDRQWLHSRVTALPAELSFSDWRSEVMGLTGQ